MSLTIIWPEIIFFRGLLGNGVETWLTVPRWGGQGITGGFVDVGGLSVCLEGIWDGKAEESILDIYSEKRIEKWKTVIDVVSQDNFRRVSDADPHTLLERDPMLMACKESELDKELQKGMMLQSMQLRYDFTQHYHRST